MGSLHIFESTRVPGGLGIEGNGEREDCVLASLSPDQRNKPICVLLPSPQKGLGGLCAGRLRLKSAQQGERPSALSSVAVRPCFHVSKGRGDCYRP